jgi:hypothetical protein
MKKILLFDLHSTHNDEHALFHNNVYKLIMLEAAVKLGIVKFITDYEVAIAAEEAAMGVDPGSVFTKTITQADGYRDQLDRSFDLLVESKTIDFDPNVRSAAERIERILKQYGLIRKLSYGDKTKAYSTRNKKLNSEYAADVATIGGNILLDQQNIANEEFLNHFGDRASEKAVAISGNVKAARIVVDDIYEAIRNQVNALALVNGEADYANFIDKVNYYVKYNKDVLAARRGRGDEDSKPTTPETPTK